jgi:hypothetical protein
MAQDDTAHETLPFAPGEAIEMLSARKALEPVERSSEWVCYVCDNRGYAYRNGICICKAHFYERSDKGS